MYQASLEINLFGNLIIDLSYVLELLLRNFIKEYLNCFMLIFS